MYQKVRQMERRTLAAIVVAAVVVLAIVVSELGVLYPASGAAVGYPAAENGALEEIPECASEACAGIVAFSPQVPEDVTFFSNQTGKGATLTITSAPMGEFTLCQTKVIGYEASIESSWAGKREIFIFADPALSASDAAGLLIGAKFNVTSEADGFCTDVKYKIVLDKWVGEEA